MTKNKLSMITLAVLLAGSMVANGYFYQQLNLEKQAVTDFLGQVSSLEKDKTDLQKQLETQQKTIKGLEQQIADSQKTIEQLKLRVQPEVKPELQPEPQQQPASSAADDANGTLNYSKMSREEKEARAMAEAMGMSYEDLIHPKKDPNANGGCEGDVSRESRKLTESEKEWYNTHKPHW